MTRVHRYSDGPFMTFPHQTLKYVRTLISLSSVKILSKSLNRKGVQFGLDRAHVFIVNRYFACKRESFFLCFMSLNFYRDIACVKKRIFFSGRMTVIYFVIRNSLIRSKMLIRIRQGDLHNRRRELYVGRKQL